MVLERSTSASHQGSLLASEGGKSSWVLCLLLEEEKGVGCSTSPRLVERRFVKVSPPCSDGKRSRHHSRSFLRVNLDPCFTEASDQAAYLSTHLHLRHEEARGAKEEAAPAHVPAPTLLCQHSQLDQLVEQFD
ncbi:hypothetical protein MA16_Dca002057 [Dendrobium catenatum]|uniref:Uncharacterized protein n=1 Tax=Dendrobium catenatum TaxID=906689 RepID=A0A2I0XE82_9ASPA|nr:hypothetical protein MA16_Dca002057 [Dendrobium catenatum]